MATVYLATDVRHERQVAVKVLRPDLSASIGADRFLQEIRIAARLGHPHIVPLLDSGAIGSETLDSRPSTLYYVMPFIKGESLRERLAREGELPVPDAVRIIRDVADALAHAHEHGVVHRDIKPENILLSGRHALVADFGVAKAVSEATGRSQVTTAGVALGTPAYMAPEQAAADPHVDHRADLYALGVVAYEMLAGEPPFAGNSPQQVLASHITETPRHLSTRRTVVPPALAEAIMRCLAKKPADRWQTAGELLAHVESVTTTPTGGSTPTETRPYAAVAKGGRRWPLAAAAAVVLLLAVAAGVWGARAFPREPVDTQVVLRDRTQLTFIGRVQAPAISPDGKQLAYVTQECSANTCVQTVEVQDVGGSASRRVLDGAASAYHLEWSPDRRHLLVTGSINRRWGTYLVPVLGGAPRRLGMGGMSGDAGASFFAGGDSLVLVPEVSTDSTQWIRVADLAGTTRDSIRVETGGRRINAVIAIPGTRWFLVGLIDTPGVHYLSIDRGGREGGRLDGPGGNVRLSSDAFWHNGYRDDQRAITRRPFDAATGAFGPRSDTVYVGRFTGFSVTADGSALALDEGAYQHSVYALDMADALAGRFEPSRRVLHGSTSFGTQLSPDGRRLLVRRSVVGPSGSRDYRPSLVPFEGGADSALTLPAGTQYVFLEDSVTLALNAKVPGGSRFSLMDLRTGTLRHATTVADSLLWDWAVLPEGGWIWIPEGGQVIRAHVGGQLREFPKPDWYEVVLQISASAGRVAFNGWNSRTADTMRVSELLLADGTSRPWLAFFVDHGDLAMLADGSVLFSAYEAADIATLYHSPDPGRIRLIGTIPRPIGEQLSVSDDLRRVELATREYFGDVWLSRVERR